ncbi:lys-63-specific deubiquitinase BRCC36 isoform 2 [Planoprotostelium fungivorum]|uniref:Lys-63-specific deubiquitinase BRCC36 isoform 2 n=1 Tax=Planoprotostelium fungivorum TaxID=1890364 RepID=A0A2P6N357_9EUKA|nr:lys-63-specific deubiquitinase BRCC36 isoform 2 [Planoprotostelium fungivorum]
MKRRLPEEYEEPHLNRVRITPDVQIILTSHALTTANEEIMGLLLGSFCEDREKQHRGTIIRETEVISVSVLRRMEKSPDRVEINSEQLTEAQAEAERLSSQLKRTINVVGWYHSHPNITAPPSFVDVRTQASYQQLDRSFVGLIVSCFNKSPDRTQRVRILAFQAVKSISSPKESMDTSLDNEYEVLHREGLSYATIPVLVDPYLLVDHNCLSRVCDVEEKMMEEETEAYERYSQRG